ncbi:BTAD domain-containing putative transcriptional regulator [Nonomuraea sp. NPDC050328]|uniref:BTAD domain-containing putative transcriptional regulator n=1 Tax=Nonomuraea sp. NPDC050328 TaxID=3364361 RepID=UPI0037BC99B7
MRFGVLGPLAVWTDEGRPVRVPEAKVRALLADLLAHEGRTVSADRLVEDLWGDEPPGSPGNTLQTKVSQLRRALEQGEPGGRELVAFQARGYVLRAADVDAARFTDLLARARASAAPQEKAALLDEALGLWRGPAYADFGDEEFARIPATRLEEQRLTALEEQAEVRLALGEHDRVADELGELVAEHPLRERLRAAHLRALYRSGRQSEALSGYAELRERLSEELGLDPGPELSALYQAMLRQDPGLDPVTPPRGPRTNLRAPLTELIGRERDVAEVRTLLDSTRLLTLTGPGGVGKTRLALAAAEGLGAAFPDGVWLVELAGVSGGPMAVAETITAELCVRDEPATGARPGVRPAELAHRLADALSGQRLLLVLDNCEHLVEPVAELVASVLGAAPGVRVLATSQESLALPGETLYAVAPLGLPSPGAAGPDELGQAAAVRLFVARASAAAPGFVLDAESAPWVAAICARLDGLPLALELAAARVRALGVRGVAERLDDRFRLLAATGRGRPARQRTLRAMIDWSWEQLTEPERLVLLRLAVHPGGCTLEAAEQVCAEPGLDVADLLDHLVARSMVESLGGTRYRLLESIAAYCLERLDPADPAFARRDRYYTELAERAEPRLYGSAQREWLERLDAEAHNLRATLAHLTDGAQAARLAGALAWYWYLRGRHREGQSALARVLTLPGGDSPRTAAWHAGFAMLTGDGTDLLERTRAVAGSTGAGDPRSRWFLALAHLTFGDAATAGDLLDRALAGFQAAGDRWGEAAALAGQAKQAVFQGEHDRAARAGRRSMELFEQLGDGWGQLQAADLLAYVAEIGGEYGLAERLHRTGLRLAEELRLWVDASYRWSGLGRIALLTGDLERARECHERGLRLAGEQSNRFAEEFARVGLGLVARRAGDLDAAEAYFLESLAWNGRLEADYGVPFYGVTLLLSELGFVAEQRGALGPARSWHEQALAAALRLGDSRAVALAKEGLAGVAAAAGSFAEAGRLLAEAEDLRASVGAPLPPGERGDVNRIQAAIHSALDAPIH